MNNIPRSQKWLTYVAWTLAGFMFAGGVIGVLNDAFGFITLPVSVGGTAVVLLFWVGAAQYLQRVGWQTEDGRITKLNLGLQLPLLGMILLLWLPTLTSLYTPLPFPREADDETLIVIATFAHSDGVADVDVDGEIQRAIQAQLTELGVKNVRVAIEPTILAVGDRAAAEALGERYNASILIWGADTGVRLTVNFLNLKQPDFAAAVADLTETTRSQLANPDAYAQFVVNRLPDMVSFLTLFAVGQSYTVQQEYKPAIAVIQKAVDSLPSDEAIPAEFELDAAYFRLGWLYQVTGDNHQAISDYTQAIALNPQSTGAFNNRGLASVDLGEVETAVSDYTQAIALNPQSAEAFNNRGNAYANLGDYETALSDLTQALTLNPQDAAAFNNRGIAYRHLGEYQTAVSDFTQAIVLDPQSAEAFNNRGNAHVTLGDYETAISDCTQAIALNPQSAESFNNRGNAYANLGDYETAVSDYTQAIALNPQDTAAFFNRALAYDRLGQKAEALADFRHYLKLNPQSPNREYIEQRIAELEAQTAP